LKLQYDETLSNFVFSFNLCRNTKALKQVDVARAAGNEAFTAGDYTRPLFSST
jgi:hypothetical protein